jgi:hypothetical protein
MLNFPYWYWLPLSVKCPTKHEQWLQRGRLVQLAFDDRDQLLALPKVIEYAIRLGSFR